MQNRERTREILTPDQAAEYLPVDRETVYRYIRTGKLDASRLGRSYRIPRQSIELLLLSTRTRPYIKLREYTDEQTAQFVDDDVLEGESLEVARRFDQATGLGFFGDTRKADASDQSA
ncbi:MAG: helix-turn-helix domain-containing protein [Chloroflexi bacterium]|nr:helix-turn-helix domain-containing protein [Chloroflexota bacterium]